MSTTDKAVTIVKERRLALAANAKAIDEIALEAAGIFEQVGSFQQEIALAQSITDIRVMLTPEMMAPVMALMNTDLGFNTDRNPRAGADKPPYGIEVVKECFIESKLRGFHTAGNEWNIIAGRFYACQAGFKRKVRVATGGTFEPSYDTPVWSSDQKKAKVKCRATWSVSGAKFDIGVRPEDPCEIVVRVNSFMGDDAIIGKSERKLLKRVYERITGRTIPEAEVGDLKDGSIETQSTRSTEAQAAPVFGDAAGAGPVTEAETKVTPQAQPVASAPTATTAALFPATPQGKLEEFMSDNGVNFDKFRTWAAQTERLENADSFATWAELPSAFCEELAKDAKALAKCVTRCKI